MRAPMVTGEGSLPETPLPVGPDEDLLGGHLVRRLCRTRPKKSWSMLE